MMLVGVLLGLGAAVFQSLSYVFTRLFVLERHQTVLRLLVLGHVIMGLASAVALPLLWSDRIAPWPRWWLPLAGASGFYLLGQGAFTVALKLAEASRAAPLLGLKIVLLAGIVALAGQQVSPMQWAGVLLATTAAVMLNYSGGSLRPGAIAAILVACLFYSLSDINIRLLIDAMAMGDDRFHASVLAAAMAYAVLLPVALPAMALVRPIRLGDLRYAAPYAASWLAAMLFLYSCFATVGVVLGNIVQSTRGLISIAMGVAIARRGITHLEGKVAGAILVRRLLAAALMAAAIALYVSG